MKCGNGTQEKEMPCSNPGFRAGTANSPKTYSYPNAQQFLSRRQRKEWLLRMSSSRKAKATEIMANSAGLSTHQLLAEGGAEPATPVKRGEVPRKEQINAKGKWNKPGYSENWLTASTVLGLDDPFHPVRENLLHFLAMQEKTDTALETRPAASPDELTRRRVFDGEKRISRRETAFASFGAPLMAALIVLAAVVWWIFSGTFQDGTRGQGFEGRATATADQGEQVAMTRVDATPGNGGVEVPLGVVRKHKLIAFEYKGAQGSVLSSLTLLRWARW